MHTHAKVSFGISFHMCLSIRVSNSGNLTQNTMTNNLFAVTALNYRTKCIDKHCRTLSDCSSDQDLQMLANFHTKPI